MEKNNFYVTWNDSTTAQVVTVAACNELAAVALAAPKCKCYSKETVRVFTEEDLKQILGKKRSCRCYSGEELIVFIEEFGDKVKIANTQFYKESVEGVSKLLLTLLVQSYEHECNNVIGSTRGFPCITIGAAPYDVEYAEPYIE